MIARELLRGAEEDQYRTLREFEMARMKAMDAYVALRGSHNMTEFSDVAPDRMQLAMKLLQPVVEATSEQNQMGRLAVADSSHGANGRDEHRGV